MAVCVCRGQRTAVSSLLLCSLEPGSLLGPEAHVFSTRAEVNKSQGSFCLRSAWSWSYRCVLGSGCWHLNSVPHDYTASALSHWSTLRALESPEWARLTLLLLWQWRMQSHVSVWNSPEAIGKKITTWTYSVQWWLTVTVTVSLGGVHCKVTPLDLVSMPKS